MTELPLRYKEEFSCLSLEGEDFSSVERILTLPESVRAPVKEGDVVGSLAYMLGDKTLGTVDILAAADAPEAGYRDYLKWTWEAFLPG